MLQPKKTEFRRQQKGRMKGNAQRGNQFASGSFGIKSLESKWITGRQIEAARAAVTCYMQRQGQVWCCIPPDKPITAKPAEVQMGKGKGNPEGFVAPMIPGCMLFEVEGVPYGVAKETLRPTVRKLPVTTRFVVRRNYDAANPNVQFVRPYITMQTSEIKEFTTEEIRERIETEQATYQQKRIDHHASPAENPAAFREQRRTIARLKTILAE